MVHIYLLFLMITVILESSALKRDINAVVDNRLVSNNQIIRNRFDTRGLLNNFYNTNTSLFTDERVKIQLYYECLCPDCRDFDTTQFKGTVITLGSYLDIKLYPYGNAQTVKHDGQVEFICQHGPTECYGNKLHACAIDYLKNVTAAVFYNSCMMDQSQVGRGSDDAAADVCGYSMGINSEPIKQCAKSARGTELLEYYGEESKKANFNSVPHILINGVENSGDNFLQDVCKAFRNPPSACRSLQP